MPERLFHAARPASFLAASAGSEVWDGKQMRPLTRQPFKARTTEELMALLSAVATAILAVIIISMLYFGRDIFVPVALAILLSFVLAPLVGILQRIHVPRGLAVVSVVILAFSMIFAMGSLLATQLTQLAGDLPRYQSTISEKIQSFRDTKAGRGTLERASDMLKDLSKELDKPKDAPSARGSGSVAGSNAPAPLTPVPVEVRQPDPGALESLRTLISPLVHPLATTGIIIIFVIFILLQREDLRNRLIRLAGSSDFQRTTAALDDAASRLSRLFLTQLILNGAFGVVIGIGLWVIGIPSAILWGILAAALRFVPYIGAVIAAAFPLALAVGVDPGWSSRDGRSRFFLLWNRSSAMSSSRWFTATARGFLRGGSRVGDLLDRTLGANWARPRYAADGVPCRARASCGAFGVS